MELREPAWTGEVPKPAAVLALQIVGALALLAGIGVLALASVLDLDPGWKKIYALIAAVGFVMAPFAFLAGWKRPPGLVAALVAMSFLLVLFPIGTLLAAIIGFLGIKNRDHVRDYYAQKAAR